MLQTNSIEKSDILWEKANNTIGWVKLHKTLCAIAKLKCVSLNKMTVYGNDGISDFKQKLHNSIELQCIMKISLYMAFKCIEVLNLDIQSMELLNICFATTITKQKII